jgi:hypothetical protein
MADVSVRADEVKAQDLLPVLSRISWGAVIAGAVVALAIYFVLTLFAAAIGLSLQDRVRPENLGTGAAIAAVVTTIVALFLGGWVTTQLAVGENTREAIIYGLTVWGVLFGMLIWLMASGVQAGFNAMIGMSNAVAAASNTNWEEAARRAGVPQDQIDSWRQKARDTATTVRETANDPATREAAAAGATRATWWALVGTLLSMAAAIGGAVLGAGPHFRLVTWPTARMSATRVTVP